MSQGIIETGTVKRNVMANFVGRGWTAFLGFIFVPLYLHFLGIEAYGLIGFFATLQAFFNLLDLGLGATLNREFARLSADEHAVCEQRNLLRTLEMVYWAIAIVVGSAIFFAAPIIAAHWIRASHLSIASITTAVRLMAMTLVVQLPFALYQGGLMGLQRQVTLNVLLTAVATFRGVGAVLMLWLLSSTVEAFLVWQLLVSLAATAATSRLVWRAIPYSGHRPLFEFPILRRVWRFAAALAAMALVNALFTQTDKVVLTRWLKLDAFGYYMLAQSLAGVLWSIVGPFSAAVFPRFSRLAARHAEGEIVELYHRACQSLSVLLLPIFLMLVFFSRQILVTWTLNVTIAQNGWAIVSLAACGVVSICLADIPHFLRLAFGWSRLSLLANILLVIAFIPLLIVMTLRYGVVGAAGTWAAVNALYLITVPLTHQRILRGEFPRWLTDDVGLPLVGALLIIVLAAWLSPYAASRPAGLLLLVSTWSSATVAAALLSRDVRSFVFMAVRRWSYRPR